MAIFGASNHENSGQICIGNCDDPEQMCHNLDGRDGSRSICQKSSLFPELLEPEPTSKRPTVMQMLLVLNWLYPVINPCSSMIG